MSYHGSEGTLHLVPWADLHQTPVSFRESVALDTVSAAAAAVTSLSVSSFTRAAAWCAGVQSPRGDLMPNGRHCCDGSRTQPASRLPRLHLAPPWEAASDPALKTRGLPVHKLNGALGLDRRHRGVDILRHNTAAVHDTNCLSWQGSHLTMAEAGSRQTR